MIIKMEEKLILQAEEQKEIRNKNMELIKINTRIANIEEHVNKNSIAKQTRNIEKSVSDIRNPAYEKEQSETIKLCTEYGLKFVKHENFGQFHFADGIHLTHDNGIPLYVRYLKHVVNPLLGVINGKQNVENHQFPRQRDTTNRQFRRENYNHFYKTPNRYEGENH
ncbi:unnamed protein product [Mytilus coruscus]|uniref:Uncharacterized protein n=1 Tax=Mytilus coruscus TaxID=42192 RepID=A0A6J8EBK0_MYTCO|nr:unnamed protein product [Mytilus coruscus]